MFNTGPKIVPPYAGMKIGYEDAVERAKSIGIVAKKNAEECVKLRRMPDENLKAIMDSGLMPLLRPSEFGGFDGDWMTHVDCISEVARYCGSTAWCMSFLLQHQFFVSMLPIEGQKKIYEQHPDPRIATSFAPTGKVKAVPGGYELTGRWKFASAVDHCDWALVGGKIPEKDNEFGNFLLSPGQFKVDRVWDSVGLAGTGSNDIVLEEPAFVADHFYYGTVDAMAGRAPGTNDIKAPLFRQPLAYNSGFGVMAPIHGIARGMYEAYVEFVGKQKALMGKVDAADNVAIQTAIGESKSEIDLAYLLTQKMCASAVQDTDLTVDDVVRVRRDFLLLRKTLGSAVDRLFGLSGARGLTESLPLQRHWRDFHALTHHITFAMPAYQTAGRLALGLTPTPGDIIANFEMNSIGGGSAMD